MKILDASGTGSKYIPGANQAFYCKRLADIVDPSGKTSSPQYGIAKNAYAKTTAMRRRPAHKSVGWQQIKDSDVFVFKVDLGHSPATDKVLIVNGNPFRLVNAENITIEGLEYPQLTWKGGTAPFCLKMQYHNPNDDSFTDVTDAMFTNVKVDLLDNDGDGANDHTIYTVHRNVDDEGWWADDLEGDITQDNIGIAITDSNEPPRTLFVPFQSVKKDSTDPNAPKTAMEQIYDHYGPPSSCDPTLTVTPQTIYYRYALDKTDLTFTAVEPATDIPIDCDIQVYRDINMTVSSDGYMPSATDAGGQTPNLVPLWIHATPRNDKHYNECMKMLTVAVNKAQTVINTSPFFSQSPTYGVTTWNNVLANIFATYNTATGPQTCQGQFLLYPSGQANQNAPQQPTLQLIPDSFTITAYFNPTDSNNLRGTGDAPTVIPLSILKNTPVPYALFVGSQYSLSYTVAPTKLQLMIDMQLWNSNHINVSGWNIYPGVGSGYSYSVSSVTGQTFTLNTDASDVLSKINVSAATIALTYTPVGANNNLYATAHYVFGITSVTTGLVGSWNVYWVETYNQMIDLHGTMKTTTSTYSHSVAIFDVSGICRIYFGTDTYAAPTSGSGDRWYRYSLVGTTLTFYEFKDYACATPLLAIIGWRTVASLNDTPIYGSQVSVTIQNITQSSQTINFHEYHADKSGLANIPDMYDEIYATFQKQ